MLSLLVALLMLVLIGPLPQDATSLEHSNIEDGDANDAIQNDVRANYEVKRGTGINYNIKDLPDEKNKKSKHHKTTHKKVNRGKKNKFSKKSKNGRSQKIQSKAKKHNKFHNDKPKSDKKLKKRKDKKIRNKIGNKQNLSERRKNKNSKNKYTNKQNQYSNEENEGKKASIRKTGSNKKGNKKFRIREKNKEKITNNKISVTARKAESKKDAKNSKIGGINILGQKEATGGNTRQAACNSNIDLNEGESIVLFSSKDKSKVKCKTTINGPTGSKLSISCPLFSLYDSNRCRVESLKLIRLSGYRGKLCGTQTVSGTTQSNRLRILYKRKKLKKKQCSAGFICTITVEGGTPVPSVSLDRACDIGATNLQPGEEVLIFPDLGSDIQLPFSCEHTIQYQGPSESGLSLTCPAISLINDCFKEVITVTDAFGFSKEFFCDEDIEYSASGGSLSFSYDKSSTGKKDCPGKFICSVTAEDPPTIPTTIGPAECQDTLPGYCIDYLTPDGWLVGVCSCSDVVWNRWCRDPAFADLAAECKLSCGLCDGQCIDTWPNICIDYFDPFVGACSCEEVVSNNWCNDPCFNFERSFCKKSCGLCDLSIPTSDECSSFTTSATITTKDRPAATTVKPTDNPTVKPSVKPPVTPTFKPTVQSTVKPSVKPPVVPTNKPTIKSTVKPTVAPTEKPNPSTGTRPYCDTCGTSSISVARMTNGNRIVGGQQATKGEYPWQVYLGIFIGQGGGQCGGSIIKKRWVLSAAHCFIGLGTITRLDIHLGAHDITDTSDPDDQIVVLNQQDVTSRVKTHPNYDEFTVQNDIALIELKDDLVFTSRIAPVCLADVSDFAAGKIGVATGWGKIAFVGNTASDILLEVGLELIDLATCQDLYQKTPNVYEIFDTMICTLTPGKDACSGDSGGPLVVQLDNGRWVQIGLTSFGYQCANPAAPGVWTHVAKYKTWIDQTTGSVQC